MEQKIITYLIVAAALIYLGFKFFYKKKNKKDCDHCK